MNDNTVYIIAPSSAARTGVIVYDALVVVTPDRQSSPGAAWYAVLSVGALPGSPAEPGHAAQARVAGVREAKRHY